MSSPRAGDPRVNPAGDMAAAGLAVYVDPKTPLPTGIGLTQSLVVRYGAEGRSLS
jgi:hypothetical protein